MSNWILIMLEYIWKKKFLSTQIFYWNNTGLSFLTEGQLIKCSPLSQGMSFSLRNLLYNIYKNNLMHLYLFGECCLINNILITWTLEYHKDTWNRQQFILRQGKLSDCFMIKKSETKLGKQLEITNYDSYVRLSNKCNCLPWKMLNHTINCYNITWKQLYNPLETVI